MIITLGFIAGVYAVCRPVLCGKSDSVGARLPPLYGYIYKEGRTFNVASRASSASACMHRGPIVLDSALAARLEHNRYSVGGRRMGMDASKSA